LIGDRLPIERVGGSKKICLQDQMLKISLQILGFYLVFVGTWRLANSTTHSPVGTELLINREKEEKYNPLLDLLAIHKIIKWFFLTIVSFNKPGRFTGVAILHKRFNWGLLWLLFGIVLQFIASFY